MSAFNKVISVQCTNANISNGYSWLFLLEPYGVNIQLLSTAEYCSIKSQFLFHVCALFDHCNVK